MRMRSSLWASSGDTHTDSTIRDEDVSSWAPNIETRDYACSWVDTPTKKPHVYCVLGTVPF